MTKSLSISLACLYAASVLPCLADAISPGIGKTGDVYSHEKPNTAYFGNGVAGRLTEASHLRFEGEQDTHDRRYDSAIRKLAKAVQLDPGDPTGHIMYARAITSRIMSAKTIDPADLKTALQEWRLIWRHDADLLEQYEARGQVKRLTKIAKALDKENKRKKKRGGDADKSYVAQKESDDWLE